MADELFTVQTWAFDTLAADDNLTALIGGEANPRIYQDTAPQAAVFPFVLIRFITPMPDLLGNAGRRLWAQSRWEVTAVTNTRSYAALNPIVKILDELLHLESGTGTGGDVLAFISDFAIRRPSPPESGIVYKESGRSYVATVIAS